MRTGHALLVMLLLLAVSGSGCGSAVDDDHCETPEVCDFEDNDCDGEIDEDLPQVVQWPDRDNDGYGDAHKPSYSFCDKIGDSSLNNLDCDDTEYDINPDAEEILDGRDNDCDGCVDEPDVAPPNGGGT